MRVVYIVLAAMALVACNAKAAHLGESDVDASIEAPLASAKMLLQRGDYTDAQQALEGYAKAPTIYQFSPARRREVIDLYAQAAFEGADYSAAHEAWRLATADSRATPDEWRGRLMSAAFARDSQDAYLAFDHLRGAAPDEIRSIAQPTLQSINTGFSLLPNAAVAHLQLAEILSSVDEVDPRADLSPLWLQAATASLENGDGKAAAGYAHRIRSPVIMVALRADKRFDALVSQNPSVYDVRALAEDGLAKARAWAEAEPELAEPQFEIAAALFNLGRQSEALQVIDAGLRRGPAYGEDPGLRIRFAARKATVLAQLGRDTEAIAIASVMCSRCNPHADMQLAHLLLGANRPAEALEALSGETPRELDAKGVGELAAMRACADHGVGRSADAARELEILKQNLRASPDETLGAMTCAGSDDEVASALVLMLRDRSMRSGALEDLQTYQDDKLSAFTRGLRVRLATIASRPDVKAELDKVGRVATYDMPRYAVVG